MFATNNNCIFDAFRAHSREPIHISLHNPWLLFLWVTTVLPGGHCSHSGRVAPIELCLDVCLQPLLGYWVVHDEHERPIFHLAHRGKDFPTCLYGEGLLVVEVAAKGYRSKVIKN